MMYVRIPSAINVYQAVLAAGYRPRFLISEVNRNFPVTAMSYSTINAEDQFWDCGCYMGASAVALTRVAQV